MAADACTCSDNGNLKAGVEDEEAASHGNPSKQATWLDLTTGLTIYLLSIMFTFYFLEKDHPICPMNRLGYVQCECQYLFIPCL